MGMHHHIQCLWYWGSNAALHIVDKLSTHQAVSLAPSLDILGHDCILGYYHLVQISFSTIKSF